MVSENTKNEDKKKILEKQEKWIDYFSKIELTYQDLAKRGELNKIELKISSESIPPPDLLNNFDLFTKSLYKDKIRNKLFDSFPEVYNIYSNAICPFCEGVFGTRITLEHVIPKSECSSLAIVPCNLVRACGECNTSTHSKRNYCDQSKRIVAPQNSEINLYFESVKISKYLDIVFREEDGKKWRWFPEVIFDKNDSNTRNSEGNLEKERVKTFVENYNLLKTYTHRVQLEYNRILLTLSKQFVIPLKKNSLRFHIRKLEERYKSDIEEEKFNDDYWLDQNYFGWLICKHLCEKLKNDDNIERLKIEIVKRRFDTSSFVTDNFENLEQFVSRINDFSNILNKDDLFRHIQKVLQDNESDFSLYREYLKNKSVRHHFTESALLTKNELKLLESIFNFFIKEEKDFSNFRDPCVILFQG